MSRVQNPLQLIREFPKFDTGLFNLITQIITQIDTFFDLYYFFLFAVIYWIKEGGQGLSSTGGLSSTDYVALKFQTNQAWG